MNNLPHKKPKGKRGMAMVKKLGRTFKTGMFDKIAAGARAAGKSAESAKKIAGAVFWNKVKNK